MSTGQPTADPEIEFKLLGPLEVVVRGRAVPVTAPRERIVLATLLLHPEELVPLPTLTEMVWGEHPPRSPANQLAAAVSALRRKLGTWADGGQVVLTGSPGYLVSLRAAWLDTRQVDRHRRRATELAAAGDTAGAVAQLRAALALWRGAPLAGLDVPGLRPAIRRWEEEHLAVWDLWADLQLKNGNYDEVIAQLSELTERHPLLERPRGHLMTALHRSGRQADALKVYRDTRSLLMTELGVEPGTQLRRIHREILRSETTPGSPAPPALPAPPPHNPAPQDPAPQDPEPQAPATQPPAAVPTRAASACLLPNDTADFTGRDTEVSRLVELLTTPGGPPLVAVFGCGGIGKTTLAVHTAHRLRAVFPDLQLHIDLRGMGQQPVSPDEALGRFLRGLGVDSCVIPEGLDQRAEMYRALLADRRGLVVLDNAASEAQVLPLLPGTSSCAVIVTSRPPLTGLPGVQLLELDLLDRQQALALLGSIVGEQRLGAEPEAAVQLVEYCGRLPLALRVAGAKLAAKGHWTIQRYVSRLTDQCTRLNELAHGHLEVRASLALSYEGLHPQAQGLLRRLGLLEMPDFGAWIGGPLMGLTPHEADNFWEELIDTRLLTVLGPDLSGQIRFRLHDLVRLYAQERAQAVDPLPLRQAALGRLGGAFLSGLTAAHRQVCGGDYAVLHGPAPRWPFDPGQQQPPITALDWYDAERHVLPSLCAQLAESGFHELCWDVAATSVSLFSTRSHFSEWQSTHEAAAAAVAAAGDQLGEAVVLLGLGDLHLARHQHDRATELLHRAVEKFEAVRAPHGRALALRKLGYVDRLTGRFDQALLRWREALNELQECGDLGAQGHVLRWIGQTLLELGDPAQAEGYLLRAMDVTHGLGGRGAAQSLLGLGELHLEQHRWEAAEAELTEVVTLTQIMGDLRGQAHALLGLGRLGIHCHRDVDARRWLEQALALATATMDVLLEVRILLALVDLGELTRDKPRALALLDDAIARCTRHGFTMWRLRCIRRRAAVSAWPSPSIPPAPAAVGY